MLVKILSSVIVVLVACLIYIIIPRTSINSNKLNVGSKTDGNNLNNRFSSSVWCYYDKLHAKICTFQNLYYLPEHRSFVFILTNESVISGLKSKSDLETISLSSVENHSNMYIKLQIVIDSSEHFKINNFVFINEPVLLIKRFKSDNIMHVIHDDILPMYMTYSHLCSGNVDDCSLNNRLMFIDDYDDNLYMEWYNLFSFKKPFNIKNLRASSCFGKVFVGLTRETVWFQYGFGIPHGPVESPTINSLIIDRFSAFVLNSFNIKETVPSFINNEFVNVVFFSRKDNRKILNENLVVKEIIETFKDVYPEYNKVIKIHVLDPSQNKSSDILKTVIKSQLLIGMHGSAMIYSLFLPKNAAVIELFPFGIQPQHVSSTRALCLLPGILCNYLSWRNFKESNSIPHPDRPALLGGIAHLSEEQQENIKNLKIVPAVECCHDPAYLFRMFQDTIIDNSFQVILKQALVNQKENFQSGVEEYFNEYLKTFWFSPGPVSDLSCKADLRNGKVLIDWSLPYNIRNNNSFKIGELLLYHVTIKIFTRIVTLESFSLTVSIKLTPEEVNAYKNENGIQVWIKAMIDGIEGSDLHTYCSTVS